MRLMVSREVRIRPASIMMPAIPMRLVRNSPPHVPGRYPAHCAVLTRGSKYPYSMSAMNMLIRKNAVSTYVAPIITGRSITVMASK